MKKFKDGDILVSDKCGIIAMMDGDYNNGSFRSHIAIEGNEIAIKPAGVWNTDYVNDWRLANARERKKLFKNLNVWRSWTQSKVEYLNKIIEKYGKE